MASTPTSRRLQAQARAYARKHDIKYTEALRALTHTPDVLTILLGPTALHLTPGGHNHVAVIGDGPLARYLADTIITRCREAGWKLYDAASAVDVMRQRTTAKDTAAAPSAAVCIAPIPRGHLASYDDDAFTVLSLGRAERITALVTVATIEQLPSGWVNNTRTIIDASGGGEFTITQDGVTIEPMRPLRRLPSGELTIPLGQSLNEQGSAAWAPRHPLTQHLLISGPTGCGKTVLARTIARQALEHDADVTIVVPHLDLGGAYRSLTDRDPVPGSGRARLVTADEAPWDELMSEQVMPAQAPRLVIFDDAETYLYHARAQQFLTWVQYMGRALDVHVVLVGQKVKAADLPGGVTSNALLAVGEPGTGTYRAAFTEQARERAHSEDGRLFTTTPVSGVRPGLPPARMVKDLCEEGAFIAFYDA